MQQKIVIGRGAALLSDLLLAAGPSIVKISDLPEMTFIFWRLLAAAAGYWIAMKLVGGKLGIKEFRSSLKGGIVFGVNLVFFVMAMRRTSAANAVMIGALQPVVLLVVAGPLFGEKPQKIVYFWSVVAMGGVAFSTYASDTTGIATRQGDLLALIGMLLFSAYYVVSKRAREDLDSMTYQLGLTLAAAITILPFAFAFGHGISPPSGGEFILAISPEKISGSDWNNHANEFFDKMKSMDGVRLPGERRHKNRLDTGPRKINKDLVDKINSLIK